MVQSVYSPTCTWLAFSHILEFLRTATLHLRPQFEAFPKSIRLLTGCLGRCEDLQSRIIPLWGLLRLFTSVTEPESRNFDAQKLIAAASKRFPPHLEARLMENPNGPTQNAIFASMVSSQYFTQLITKLAQRKVDLYSFGKDLYHLVLHTEYSVMDGGFHDQHGKMINIGLGFQSWIDSLPQAAKAIQAKGVSFEVIIADVLDVKWFMLRSKKKKVR